MRSADKIAKGAADLSSKALKTIAETTSSVQADNAATSVAERTGAIAVVGAGKAGDAVKDTVKQGEGIVRDRINQSICKQNPNAC